MTEEQKTIHARAISARERFRDFEMEFVKILQDAERSKLHRAMGYPSLYSYAVEELRFTESVAYMFIAVARKSREVPELLTSGLSVFKSSRMVAVIRADNATELIGFAKANSTRKLDAEVARRNPKARPEKVKPLSEESLELTVQVSKDFAAKLSRVQSLLAQKGTDAGVGAALEASVDEYLWANCPVEKAKRSLARKNGKAQKTEAAAASGESAPTELCAHRVPQRIPLTAEQKHQVFARDGGQCTHIDAKGKRCGSDRWLQIHHLIEVSRGGSNEPENLTTLCSFHHDWVHQLSFPAGEFEVG